MPTPMAGLAMAAVAALAALWLTRPLWSRETVAALRRRRANVAAYRGRLAEIDSELSAGALDAATAQSLRDEAAARVLRDSTDADTDSPPTAPPRRLRLALVLTVLLGVVSALAYWQSDTWRTRALIDLAGRDPAAAERQMLGNMVASLRKRLRTHPDDAESWAMFGQSQQLLGQYPEAVQAYDRALQLSAAEPQVDWLVGAGEARALARDDRDLQASRALFEQALTLEPGHPKALWYAGLAAIQAGDAEVAFRHWSMLRTQALPDEVASILDAQLPVLAERAGQTWKAPASGAVSLQIRVRLDDALREQFKPGMTLLVFAKAESGPPMPLAVQRIESPQLPLTVTLDDSLAMMPAMKLSGFDRWVVTARLTTSGGAQALSGDLEGRHAAGRAEAGAPIDLVIDQRLP